MQWYINLPTRQKLFLAFGFVLVLLAIVAIKSYTGIEEIQTSQQRLYDVEFTKALDLMTLRNNLNRQRAVLLTIMSAGDSSKLREWRQEIDSCTAENETIMQTLLAVTQDDPLVLTKLQELDSTRKAFDRTRNTEIFPLIEQGKMEAARAIALGIQQQRQMIIKSIGDQIGSKAKADARAAITRSEQLANHVRQACLIVSLLAIIASVATATVLNRIIANPLKEISQAAEQIAQGDIRINLPLNNRSDEVGALVQTFAHMTQSLHKMALVAEQIAGSNLKVLVEPQSTKDILGNALCLMVENLQQTTSQIADAVSVLGSSVAEILASTTETAAGMTETAAAVTQTATTVEQVRQTAQVANQKANYVAESAQQAAQVSQTGKKATEDTSAGMSRIAEQMNSIAECMVKLSEHNQAIGGIVATVEDLAQQSNLLAVNAAIEAAKAGEAGKGFAVVAQEVKSLAEQSKQATNQVRNILNDVQKATNAAVMATEQGSKVVEIGVKQSAQAGNSILILADSVAASAQAASQIAASTQQQLTGMEQVVIAMMSIKEATNQNVTATKQIEEAGWSLNELGQKLKQLLDTYKV